MKLCDEKYNKILESDVMEEEVMRWNVLLLELEFFEYLPFVKGTSDENERVSVLERVMEVVPRNESYLVVNVVN